MRLRKLVPMQVFNLYFYVILTRNFKIPIDSQAQTLASVVASNFT